MTAPLRTDLDNFLFAAIADDTNGMPLTMITALARSGVDPWVEAADLAVLSRESATQKLILLLAGMPNGPAPGADTATVASRLVALLHTPAKPRAASGSASRSPDVVAAPPRRFKLAIYSVLALIVALLSHCAMAHRDAPTPADISAPAAR
jgi:hypothetical protein